MTAARARARPDRNPHPREEAMTDELWQKSACELAEGMSRRTFSSREVMESVVKRIRAGNGALNAIVFDYTEEALADSSGRTRRSQRAGCVARCTASPSRSRKTPTSRASRRRTVVSRAQRRRLLFSPSDRPHYQIITYVLDVGAAGFHRLRLASAARRPWWRPGTAHWRDHRDRRRGGRPCSRTAPGCAARAPCSGRPRC